MLGLINKLLLEHVGLLHVLDLAVHLVNFFGWVSQGGHSDWSSLWDFGLGLRTWA